LLFVNHDWRRPEARKSQPGARASLPAMSAKARTEAAAALKVESPCFFVSVLTHAWRAGMPALPARSSSLILRPLVTPSGPPVNFSIFSGGVFG
jgi:hypothetical protein